MSGTRSITSDPNRATNTKALGDSLRLHRDQERTKEVVSDAPAAGSVQADLQDFRNYHHEQALSDVASDATGRSNVDNAYLGAVEELNGLYDASAADGELSVEEQDELLAAADAVSEAEVASRDVFFVDAGSSMEPTHDHDHDHDHGATDAVVGANPPLNPAEVGSNFQYVAAPTAEQIGAGAPLGFGHDNDGDNMVVSDVQQQLFDGGYYGEGATESEVDGYYGPLTQQAVEMFQADQGLEVTGQIGQDDLVALGLADEADAMEPSSGPTEIARTPDGRVIPGSLPTPSLEDGAREVVELRGGSPDHLTRQAETLRAQGYVHDGRGTFYHPDIALEHPDLRVTVGGAADASDLHDDLTNQGYIHDGEQTYYSPHLAHLIPGAVVDLSGVPEGIVRAERPELRQQGYIERDGVFIDPSLVTEISGSPTAAEAQAESLREQGWLHDGQGTYFHPGVAQHFLG